MSYRDLNNSDGSIDLRVLMTLALRRALQERAEYQRLGYDQPWRRCPSEALSVCGKSPRISATPSLRRVPRPSPSTPPARCVANSRLPYRDDYRAAQLRRRDIESELVRLAI
jgi:hypothetical protein